MIVRGLKIDRIREAFSKVKQDITELKSKLNEFQTKLEDNALRIDERLDKEEFYNFVKELNDELGKLEKHIVTQAILDNLRKNINAQIKELREAKGIKQKLRELNTSTTRAHNELNRISYTVNGLKNKLERLSAAIVNYASYENVQELIEELRKDEVIPKLERLESSLKESINELREELKGTREDYATKEELRIGVKQLKGILKEQAKLIKAQQKQIDKLNRKLEEIKETKRIIKGKTGLIEKGLTRVSKRVSKRWPYFALILIAILLVLGLVFFRKDLFSSELYMSPETLECRAKFECMRLDNETYLTSCVYDETLQGCHCLAKPKELANCSNKLNIPSK